MGVFACQICGDPAAYMSHSPATMVHHCPAGPIYREYREAYRAGQAAAAEHIWYSVKKFGEPTRSYPSWIESGDCL